MPAARIVGEANARISRTAPRKEPPELSEAVRTIALVQFTIPAVKHDGIWFPMETDKDIRAEVAWSAAAKRSPIHAAAASGDADPFAKYPEWIRQHFAEAEGTMLDAGCGYGRVSIPLLKANPKLRCIGVDASPVMLRLFQELAREHGVSGRVECYCGNITPLPFPDDHFQLLLSSAVLLHLPKAEARTAIREFRRVLSLHGKLVLNASFPNALNPESICNIRNNFLATPNGNVRTYTRSELRRLFSDFAETEIEAHQMIVLPRSIAGFSVPFAHLSRKVNKYCSDRFISKFKNSSFLVNHHDVIAIK